MCRDRVTHGNARSNRIAAPRVSAIRDGVPTCVVRQCTDRGGQSRGISDFTEPDPVLLSSRVMSASTYLDGLTHTNAVSTELAVISAHTRTPPSATPRDMDSVIAAPHHSIASD